MNRAIKKARKKKAMGISHATAFFSETHPHIPVVLAFPIVGAKNGRPGEWIPF